MVIGGVSANHFKTIKQKVSNHKGAYGNNGPCDELMIGRERDENSICTTYFGLKTCIELADN